MITSTKICTVCKIEKELTFFYFNNRNKVNCNGSYSSKCKDCTSKIAAKKALQRRLSKMVATEATCSICHITKPSSDFNMSSHSTTGLTTACRACNKYKRIAKVKLLKENGFIAPVKVCYTCKVEKPSNMFRKNKSIADGLNSNCKECTSIKRKQKKELIIANRISVSTKICFSCKEEKDSSCFSKDSMTNDGLYYNCKACVNAANVLDYATNEVRRVKSRIRSNKWNADNPGLNAKKATDYYYANKNLIREKALVRERHKYSSDPYFNLVHRLRRRFRGALTGRIKSKPTLTLLGCSLEEFKVYFESKFTDTMTWNAYLEGKIHVDHIIPCSYFDLTQQEEQERCFNYRNLQPLWGAENSSKGDTIVWSEELRTLLDTLNEVVLLNQLLANSNVFIKSSEFAASPAFA